MSKPQRIAQESLIPKEEPREAPPLAFDPERPAVGTGQVKIEAASLTNTSLLPSFVKSENKPRLVFDGVLLWRAKDVYAKVKKEQDITKPKIKIKKKDEAIQLPPHLLDLRLKGLKIFDVDGALRAAGLDPTIKDLPVHRRLISQNFGGGLQETFTQPAPHFVAHHGIREAFAYPIMTVNPHAPTIAGHPGLFFSAGFEKVEVYYVVVGMGVNQWLVVGRYEFREAPVLTTEEWAAVSPAARRAWAGHIMRDSWGENMRLRVALRKQLGRQLRRGEAQTVVPNRQILGSLVEEDIVDAVSRGEEEVTVSTMECIGYDVNMAKRIAELYDNGAWTMRPQADQKAFVNDLKAKMPRKPKQNGRKSKTKVKEEQTMKVEAEVESEVDDSDENENENDDGNNTT